MFDQLRAMLNHREWKPTKAGHELVGQVVGRRQIENQYGPAVLLLVATEDGIYEWAAFGTSAGHFIEENDPRYGDWIGVRFEGEQTSAGGQKFKAFRGVLIPERHASPRSGGVVMAAGQADTTPAAGGAHPAATSGDTPPVSPVGEAPTSDGGAAREGRPSSPTNPDVEQHAPSVDPGEGSSPPLPAPSPGSPNCDSCGQPITGNLKELDGHRYHPTCAARLPADHPLNKAREALG